MAQPVLSNAATVRQKSRDRTLFTEHAPAHSPSFSAQRTTVIAIAAGGIVVSGLVAAVLYGRSRALESDAFAQSAATTASAVEQSLRTPLEALHAVDAFTTAVPHNDRHQFSEFARPLLARHPSLAALEWAEFVAGDERAAFEARVSRELGAPFAIREPDARGTMRPSPVRSRYVVLRRLEPYLEPLDGLEVAFEPQRARFLDDALARRATSASARFRLVEDPPHVYSIAVYAPQFNGRRPTGISIALYRLRPLVDAALRATQRSSANLALLDSDPRLDTSERTLYVTREGADAPPRSAMVFDREIQFGGRRWTARLSREREGHAALPLAVWAFGSLVAVALAIAQGATRRVRSLQARNAELASLGQYSLEHEIGAGGMGRVYLARHRLLRRPAAVKVIGREYASEDLLRRFDREARLTSELTHPNTVTVFDYGRTDNGEFYYVMEYIRGVSFYSLVTEHGPLSPARMRHVLLQACEALAEAHDKGLVHRDLKPSNLMLCERGGIHDFVKVLDFGLVKPADVNTTTTDADVVVGTPRYMAPEAFLAPSTVKGPADIYAIGCIAHFLLTGHDVFGDLTDDALQEAHTLRAPPSLADHGCEASAELEAFVHKCLEKQPEKRFRSMRQLVMRLRELDLGRWREADAARCWREIESKLDPA
ncbi:MAG: protein kinase [Myxococcales bacterium]|nr:protein kinase [Myxococcales bacterium]